MKPDTRFKELSMKTDIGQDEHAVVLIPVYDPTDSFLPFVQGLAERLDGSNVNIVIVNDGCAPEFKAALESAAALPLVELVNHKTNLGKGVASKTGLDVIREKYPDCCGVVTADADGQHMIEDIQALVAAGQNQKDAAFILGVRHFDKDVPLRSRLGNIITRGVFYMLTAVKIEDTQTGLRFIPSPYITDLLKLTAQGYAFEMEMLLWAKQHNVDINSVHINTVYIDHNKGSHFKPFTDSLKIYAVLLKQVLSSSITATVDLCAFAIFFHFTSWLFVANAFSRAVAFPVYYYLNRDFVFNRAALGLHPVPKLIAAIVVSGLVSYALQFGLQQALGWPEVFSKLLVEILVFFVNFVVLRDWVYRK